MITKLMFCQGPSANPCWLGVCEVTHVCGCARIALTEVIRLGVLLVQRWLSILVHPMSLPM